MKRIFFRATVFLAPLSLIFTFFAQAETFPQVNAKEGFHLGKPVPVGGIAVIPIESDRAINPHKYITLAEAVKRGLVEIIELPGQESVNTLRVRNKARLPLILFAGELLLGGKQDRIVAKDTIIPPGETYDVAVFCVEHGRWHGKDVKFTGGAGYVPQNVREAAYETASQSDVWAEVDKANERAGAAPATKTIQGALNQPKLKKEVTELAEKLDKAFEKFPNAVGFIVWMNGEIRSAELFANSALFTANRKKLLESYAMEAKLTKAKNTTPVDLAKCNAFLRDILSAKRMMADKDSSSTRWRIQDGKVIGVEAGSTEYKGGFGAGFGHGTYKPGRGGK